MNLEEACVALAPFHYYEKKNPREEGRVTRLPGEGEGGGRDASKKVKFARIIPLPGYTRYSMRLGREKKTYQKPQHEGYS